jgi:hypothetical protein
VLGLDGRNQQAVVAVAAFALAERQNIGTAIALWRNVIRCCFLSAQPALIRHATIKRDELH